MDAAKSPRGFWWISRNCSRNSMWTRLKFICIAGGIRCFCLHPGLSHREFQRRGSHLTASFLRTRTPLGQFPTFPTLLLFPSRLWNGWKSGWLEPRRALLRQLSFQHVRRILKASRLRDAIAISRKVRTNKKTPGGECPGVFLILLRQGVLQPLLPLRENRLVHPLGNAHVVNGGGKIHSRSK